MEMSSSDMNKSQVDNAPPQYPGPPLPGGGVSVVDNPPMASVGVTIVQQPTATPIGVGGVVVMHNQRMGPHPTGTVCRSCNQQIVTKVEVKSSLKTHLFAVILCIVFCPCVCLPYCIDSCKTAQHYCPNCNAYIGSDN